MPYLISNHDCYCGDSRYFGPHGLWSGKCPGRDYSRWPNKEFYNCPRNSVQAMLSENLRGENQQPETD